MDHSSPISRFGTPMSSQCEGRRPSLGWSFLAGPLSHPSHPSSIASFRSSHEPHTPPPYAMPVEFTINANESCENFSIPVQTKPTYHESQLVQDSTMNGAFETQPEAEWFYTQRSTDSTMNRLPFYGNEAMIPTSGYYNPTLGPDLHHETNFQTEQQALGNSSYSSPWSPQQAVISYPAVESFEWQQPMRPLASTIVQTDVVRDRDILHQDSHLQGYQECHSEIHSPRDYYALSHKDIGSHYKSEPSLSEQGDETWTPHSKMMTPDFGIKKERRSSTKDRRSTSGKRRSRITKSTPEQTVKFNNGFVDLQRQPIRNSKKHVCRYILENGQVCATGFERVEHLRRHEQIHLSTRPFVCPLHLDPEFKCNKTFGRRDNWRDHLRTHISDTTSGRNDRTSFSTMFRLLRDSEDAEEAEKTINMLLKWKGRGGNKKNTSQPTRGSRL